EPGAVVAGGGGAVGIGGQVVVDDDEVGGRLVPLGALRGDDRAGRVEDVEPQLGGPAGGDGGGEQVEAVPAGLVAGGGRPARRAAVRLPGPVRGVVVGGLLAVHGVVVVPADVDGPDGGTDAGAAGEGEHEHGGDGGEPGRGAHASASSQPAPSTAAATAARESGPSEV